jgi:hypothetical protein
MSPITLEHRLSRRLLSGIVGLVMAFGVLLGVLLSLDLARAFDRTLESKARAVIDFYRGQPPLNSVDLTLEENGQPRYLALRLRDGTVTEPAGDLRLGPNLIEGPPRFRDITLAGGQSGRQVEIDFTPAPEVAAAQADNLSPAPLVSLMVAEPMAPLYWKIFYTSLILAALWALLLLALTLLVKSALQHGLEPLVGLKRQLETLDVEHVTHRVNLLDPPRELVPVVRRINQLLRNAQEHPRHESLPRDIAHSR